jgi:hypothetical protein
MNASSHTFYGDWRRLDDHLNVLHWRIQRLIDLGYSRRKAARLAATSIDTHELERLIRMGCPPLTAVRIAA